MIKKIITTDTHYSGVIMSMMASQVTGVLFVCATVCSGADQRNHKTPRHWPLWGEFPHKGPVMRKMFPVGDAVTSSCMQTVICVNHRIDHTPIVIFNRWHIIINIVSKLSNLFSKYGEQIQCLQMLTGCIMSQICKCIWILISCYCLIRFQKSI